MEANRTPDANFGGRKLLTSTSHFYLDLLTPPSSGDKDKSFERGLLFSPADTPLSHRSNDNSLPRAFSRKCTISSSCAKASSNLSAIEEESAEEPSKVNSTRVLSNAPASNIEVTPAGVITPVSPLSKKRSHFTLREQGVDVKQDVTPRANPEGTPRKRVKTLHFHNQALLTSDQKENSPIKVIIGNDILNGRFSVKSREFLKCLVLKPPPIPLVLRAMERLQENKPVDILAALHQKNLHHVIKKILNQLEPLDLVNIEKVSVCWSQIAMDVVSGKLGQAKKLALTSKENLMLRLPPPKNRSKRSNETTPRKITVKVRNSIDSPKRRIFESPDLSPGTKRFYAFVEQGKCLSPSKKLEKCPTCRFPARVTDEDCATCSACKVTFCIQCRCAPHPLTRCNFVLSSSPSPLKPSVRPCIASKASRKALRRLIN